MDGAGIKCDEHGFVYCIRLNLLSEHYFQSSSPVLRGRYPWYCLANPFTLLNDHILIADPKDNGQKGKQVSQKSTDMDKRIGSVNARRHVATTRSSHPFTHRFCLHHLHLLLDHEVQMVRRQSF